MNKGEGGYMGPSLEASPRAISTQSGPKKVSLTLSYRLNTHILLGWTPSTFVSSRSDRVKQKGSRPEDFMDEEDLAELKEGRNLVDTNDEMDLLGGTQAELGRRGGVEEPEKE